MQIIQSSFFCSNGMFKMLLNVPFEPKTQVHKCEVDCIKKRYPGIPNLDNCIEIKTVSESIAINKDTQEWSIWFQNCVSRRWWGQCAMVGYKRIVIGVKEQPEGGGGIHCKSIAEIDIEELPKMAVGWSPEDAFKFLDPFLRALKNEVIQDDANIVYMVTVKKSTHRDGADISFEKLTKSDPKAVEVVTEEMTRKLNGIYFSRLYQIRFPRITPSHPM